MSKFAPIVVLLCFFLNCEVNKSSNMSYTSENNESAESKELITQLREKAKEALTYCKSKQMNTDFCLLFDVSMHSGKNRMFLWDFKGDSIISSSLSAHGCGKGNRRSTEKKALFSNEEGSYLTSLGKYKIGIRSYSNWGINVHYKLHGLESTNSNAFKRIVVLHSHTPVPSHEIYPNYLPMGISLGCPVVDDKMMTLLDKKLSSVAKPVLLWIYTE